MTSIPPPQLGAAPVRLRSLHNRIFNVIGLAGAALLAGLVAVLAQSLPVRIVAALIFLGLAVWAVRGALVGVACTAEGMVIRELTRTHRVVWGDVVAVDTRSVPRFKVVVPELRIYADEGRRGGGRISAMCLADKRDPVVERHVQTLTDHWRAHVADSAG